MHKLIRTILDIIFPPLCVGCKTTLKDTAEPVCTTCKNNISLQDAFYCSECHKRMPAISGRIKKCLCKNSFILGSATFYTPGTTQELIKLLKYKGITSAAPVLGDLLAQFIARSGISLKNFLVIPIPLAKQRERERGYNQSELIAKSFIKKVELPESVLLSSALTRQKNTKPQTEMASWQERVKNVRGMFRVAQPENIKGKSIVLVDDVYTSGATSREAVATLKAAGARRVVVLAVAKTRNPY